MGNGNRAEAERTLGAFVIFDILLALFVCLAIETFIHELIAGFGGDAATSPLATTYLCIATPGYALNIVAAGLAPFLLAQGHSRLAATILGTGIGLNLLLDPLFIFAFGWGIAGAAWATTLSGFASVALAVGFTYRNHELRLRRSNLHLSWRLMRPCLALGLTPMALVMAETVQLGVYNRLLLHLGGDMAIGAIALVVVLYDFFYFPIYGMAYGAQPITSYNLGAGQPERALTNVQMLMKSTLVWSLVVWVLMVFFTAPIVSLVLGNVPLSAFAAPLVRLSFIVCFVGMLQFVCQNTLQAMNHPKTTFCLGLSQTVLLLPLVVVLPRLFPSSATQSVFLARPIVDIIVCIITLSILLKYIKQFKTSKI